MKANESLNIVKNIDSKFIVQLTQIAYLYYSVKGFNVALIYLKAIKLILSILFDGCVSRGCSPFMAKHLIRHLVGAEFGI